MELIKNEQCKKDREEIIKSLDVIVAEKVLNFHRSFPVYEETPLVKLSDFAKYAGVKDVFVKDESFRFGLNAFKVLGGSYAIGKYIADRLGNGVDALTYETLISSATKENLGDITFISATDGNHGRGVAWTANQLQQKSIILMPKGSEAERLENIRKEGADASITDLNYDEEGKERGIKG